MPSAGYADERGLEAVEQELNAIRRELSEIKALLRSAIHGRGQPEPKVIKTNNRPAMGQPDAPITIVEFSDYQCPFCQQFAESTLPLLKAEYIDSGKVRYVYRDLPLDLHPFARKAAEVALCAGEQGKYWAMHDILFRNQQSFANSVFSEYAVSLDLDSLLFEECLDSARYRQEIQNELIEGQRLGIQGTPTFFIGRSESDESIVGRPLVGAQPYPVFRKLIDEELGKLLEKK
jgi:protein-disulfide isomerase